MSATERLLAMVDAALARAVLDHPGPFVVVEADTSTVVGPFPGIPEALAGMEAWRAELERDGEPDAQLRIEPLFAPDTAEVKAS